MNSPLASTVVALSLTVGLWVGRSQIPLPTPPRSVDGEVLRVTPSVGGGATLRVKSSRGSRMVLLSAQLGVIEPLSPGDFIQVQGYERRWRGRKFLVPMTRRHVQRVASRIRLAEACRLEPGHVVTFRARPKEAELFTSRAGREHLRFTLVDTDVRCQAILYQGTFGARERELVSSPKTLQFWARTARYRGLPSMEIRKVEEIP